MGELETATLFRDIIIGAALTILVALLTILLAPAYFYRVNAFMVIFTSILIILKYFSENNKW